MNRLATLLFAAVIGTSSSARAEHRWEIDPERSTITFAYTLFGSPAAGAFEAMRGSGRFRASAPEATVFSLEIAVDSLDLGQTLINAYALSAEWFDAAKHPTARYRLSRLRIDDRGQAWALGDLTLKGTQIIFETPVTLDIGADEARASGAMIFERTDFGIGVGPTALLVDLHDEVEVRFDLIATPADPGN